jgi:hypothetical protein
MVIAALALAMPAQASWQLHCDQGKCRASAYVDREALPKIIACGQGGCPASVYSHLDTSPGHIRYMAEFSDRAEFTITPLITREQFQKDYTSTPPTYESFDAQQYVPAPFFSDKLARIGVDGQLIGTARMAAKAQIALSPADAYSLIEAVKHGRELEVEFAIGPDGYDPPIAFDLTDLPDALSKLTGHFVGELGAKGLQQVPVVAADELALVALMLDAGNQHGVHGADLRVIANPHGSGSFVYVDGREGFIWFVNGGDVIAVSGWAKNVTPAGLDPYEVRAEFWNGTGLDADNVFGVGAHTAYPR